MTETELAVVEPIEQALGAVDPQDVDAEAQYIASPDPEYTGNRIAPERKAVIYTLRDTLGLSTTAIADRLTMDWRTVNAILKRRDTDAIAARNLLDVNSLDAAKAWVLACQTGAAKGRHEPARDLLLHRGVIEPVKVEAPSNSVVVVLNGGIAPPELKSIDVKR